MTTSSPIVEVVLNGTHVPIDRDVFASLFHNSVVASYADVRKALADSQCRSSNS